MKKKMAVLAMATGLSVLSTIPAFAGQWKQDNIGWWYQEDNGSYPVSTWKWIDGNGDGAAECYYFNVSGYMLSNTSTPDSYSVNNDGAWTVNGIVQTKQVGLNDTLQEKTDNSINDNIGGGGKDKIWTGGEQAIYDAIDEYTKKEAEEWMKDMPPYPSGNGNYTGGGNIHF